MTRIEESAQIRPAWLYPAEIQDKARAAREECEKLAPRIRSRLAVQYAQMEAAQAMDFTSDAAPMPPKAPRVFGRSQNEMGFNTIQRVKERPGPEPEPKRRRSGERQQERPIRHKPATPKQTQPAAVSIEPERQRIAESPESRTMSLPERIHAILLEHGPLTNVDLSKILVASLDTVSSNTSKMHRYGELTIVGKEPRRRASPANLYAAGAKKPGRYYLGDSVTSAAAWLKSDGPKTAIEIGEFLGEGINHMSVIERMKRYGLAHKKSRVESPVTGRSIVLYAAGPEPKEA